MPNSRATSNLEGFIRTPQGDFIVEQSDKYRPAEQAAMRLLCENLPKELRGGVAYAGDCFKYIRSHIETAEIPRFGPVLEHRISELERRLNRCSQADAIEIAEEARSMVASLAMRLGDAGTVMLKVYSESPGNVAEMSSTLNQLSQIFPIHRYHQQALAIDTSRPDARSSMSVVYDKALGAIRELGTVSFGPSPDALIEAARQGRSFDEVRRSMLLDR